MIGRQDGETLADFQQFITERAHRIINESTDDEERIIAALSEIGFCAVIDHMAEIIEQHQRQEDEQ